MSTYTEKYQPNTWKHINPYGEWLSTFKWKYIATLRPYWRINENTGETYFNKLSKLNAVENLFYVTALEIKEEMPLFQIEVVK